MGLCGHGGEITTVKWATGQPQTDQLLFRSRVFLGSLQSPQVMDTAWLSKQILRFGLGAGITRSNWEMELIIIARHRSKSPYLGCPSIRAELLPATTIVSSPPTISMDMWLSGVLTTTLISLGKATTLRSVSLQVRIQVRILVSQLLRETTTGITRYFSRSPKFRLHILV